MYGFFKLNHKLFGIRVSEKDEIEGLDMPEMGVKGYDDSGSQGREYSPLPGKEIYNSL
jgi:ammonia channel protein AmtB